MTSRPVHPLTPFPRGWYLASYSDELRTGDVKPLQLFGRDLVLFRDAAGAARLADAYCPHLGAHLGRGGKVVGACIRCPFHGWEFSGATGACERTASGDPAPPKARLERWPLVERHGMVLVWFHEQREPATWDVGDLPDLEGPGWSPWHHREWRLRTTIQDISENDADVAHSPVMHGFTEQMPALAMDADGARCSWQMSALIKLAAFGVPRVPGLSALLRIPERAPSEISVLRWGLSLGWIRTDLELPFGQTFRSQTLATTTPIDAEHVRLTLRHRVRHVPLIGGVVLANYSRLFNAIVAQDIEIWEHKIYRMRPVASRSDWAVLRFRKWARQFYDPIAYDAALGGNPEPALP
jgi:3-ketosteroid 9alpha-monooxygenase subunit A